LAEIFDVAALVDAGHAVGLRAATQMAVSSGKSLGSYLTPSSSPSVWHYTKVGSVALPLKV
jgi:hypothetical protein